MLHAFVYFIIELVFGFSPSKYDIHESDGSVTVNVFFIHGIPGDYQPIVLISTHNRTATGQIFHKIKLMTYLSWYTTEGTDFVAIASMEVTFTTGNRIKSLATPVISTNSTESSEEFTVTLDEVILIHTNSRTTQNLSEEESARLILNPRVADIIILDDNGKY